MESTPDQTLTGVLAFMITFVAAGGSLWLLHRALGRSRADLAVIKPISAAFVVRVLMAGALSLTSFGAAVRGGDEEGIIFFGRELGAMPLASPEWTDALTHQLFIFVVGLHEKLLAPPELALRTMEAGIAVAGLLLLTVAVYDLAGARAASVAGWLLAFEPTSIFFTTVVHKESLILLASGLVAYGGVRMWKHPRLAPLVPMGAGCLIAAATRGYASWFLLASAAVISLHAVTRTRERGSAPSLAVLGVVVLVLVVGAPRVIEVTSEERLQRTLQVSQNANAVGPANLNLERVDFSSRGALITNLPIRIRDILLKPYPWQLGNVSQQLGLLGTTVAYLLLGAVLLVAIRGGGGYMERAGPLIYLTAFLLITYALSAGNAGTAFRYRTHIIAGLICVVVCLRAARAGEPAASKIGATSGENL